MKVKKNKAMITGVGGFIGSHLADQLLSMNYEVYGIDTEDLNNIKNLNDAKSNPHFFYTQGDITSRNTIKEFFVKDADIIYHLASVVGVRKYMEDPIALINTAIIGSKNILEESILNNTRVLFSSTSEVYGNNKKTPWKEDSDRVLGDTSVDRWCYSSSKSLVEHMLYALHNSQKIKFSTVRFFNVYGPRQSPIYVVSQTIHRLLNNKSPDLYDNGTQVRCFTYIDDAVDGMIKASTSNLAIGHAFNIGSEVQSSIKDVVNLCKNKVNKNILINKIDTKLKYGSVYQDIDVRVPDASKAKEILNWSCKTELEDGIDKTVNWAKNNSWYLKSN